MRKISSKNSEIIWKHLSNLEKCKLQNVCSKCIDALTKRLGLSHLVEYHIVLKGDKEIRNHPYKLAHPKMEIMRKM